MNRTTDRLRFSASLDASTLGRDDVVGRARSMALRLHDLIAAKGVQLTDILEEVKAEEYFFDPADA